MEPPPPEGAGAPTFGDGSRASRKLGRNHPELNGVYA